MGKIILLVLITILLVSVLSAYEFTSPSSVSSFCGEEGGSVATNTIDNDGTTFWGHLGGETHNITYNLGSSLIVDQIRLWIGDPDEVFAYAPCLLTAIYVCDDSACSGESTLGTCGTWTGAAGNRTCDITDTTGQYIRIYLNSYEFSCDPVDMDLFYDFYYLQGDTCTPPATGNYAVTASDNCAWTTNDEIPGNITITGDGNLTLRANWTFTGSNQYIFIQGDIEFAIFEGGSING